MPGHHPKSPGWYPDPDILPGVRGFLRYWNGRRWTDQWRPIPILTNLTLGGPNGVPQPHALEGPARLAELPAPAAEVSAARDAPAGRTDTMDRPVGAEVRGVELPPSAGSGRGIPPQPPDSGGGGGGGGGDGTGPDGTARSRKRRWWLFAGAAVLCSLAVVLVGEAMRPPSAGPRVLTDNRFVQLANTECAKTLPTLRPPDGGPMGSAVSPALVATQIDKAATGLDGLATTLAALPAAAPDQPYIASWLDGWRRYDVAGHQYADYLRSHPPTGKAPPMLKLAADLAKATDSFSRANGLSSCLFAYAYAYDPSQF